jgi:hypothetical protein
MGLIESLLPETIPLTDEQFRTFLDKTLTTEHSRRILAGLTAQNATTDATQAAGTAERDNPTHAAGSAETAARAGGTATAETTGAAQGSGLRPSPLQSKGALIYHNGKPFVVSCALPGAFAPVGANYGARCARKTTAANRSFLEYSLPLYLFFATFCADKLEFITPYQYL